jgi:hypothetical protein
MNLKWWNFFEQQPGNRPRKTGFEKEAGTTLKKSAFAIALGACAQERNAGTT